MVKNPPANAGHKRYRFDPWVRKIPWRRAWQATPVFLPGKSPRPEEPVVLTVHEFAKSCTHEHILYKNS